MGCGHFPDAPAHPHQGEGFKAVEIVEPPGLPADKPPALTLQPGDSVTIESRSDQTQQFAGLMIDATGNIHLPLTGDIQIGGLGQDAAEQRVQDALKKFDRFVQVTLLVSARGGQRATVLGAVNQQGSVELIPGARVTDLVAGAGGPITATTGPNPVPVADLSGAVLMRKGEAVPISMLK
jgi:protein involved in polysaccharide export with SLBB domain